MKRELVSIQRYPMNSLNPLNHGSDNES